MSTDSPSTPIVLKASDIRRDFTVGKNRIPVLQGVDLELHAGQLISIQGESGCGKTTLLNILAKLESMDSGELYWNEQPIHTLPPSQIHRHRARLIGMVFQQPHLVPELNTLDNVLLAARIAHQVAGAEPRARSLLTRLGLEARIHHPVQKLSGGEKQRVAIARALVNRPPLLFADEPTGNLDETTADHVFSLFMKVIQEENTGVLLVTHSPLLAERTPYQLRLHLGKLEPVHV